MIRRNRAYSDTDISHERWLVSYADFVTLLFAFFVVMYSVSQVNEEKYEKLSEVLESMFSDPARQEDRDIIDDKDVVVNVDDLLVLKENISEQFSSLISDNDITVAQNELWLEISLNNRILFDVGGIQPKSEAVQLFEEMAPLLNETEYPIQVEGFTDNLPISTGQFPSNWELSSARASAVIKLLIENNIAPNRLAAVGYGEHQPIASNLTDEGRAKNRRVSLMIGKHPRHRPIQTDEQPNATSKGEEPAISKPEIEAETGIQPELKAETKAETDVQPEATTETGIQPVLLDNGEYLFSSDPDLPRENAKPPAEK